MHASPALQALVEQRAPYRPWSAQIKKGSHVRPRAVALSEPYIQLNPPCLASWLILDIDRVRAALSWERANLPPPTFVATNPDNGHAQIGYALRAPVCTSAAGRDHPVRYLAAIEVGFIRALDADTAFNGPLGKNPLHPHWKLWEPANAPTYELGLLADYVTLPQRLPRFRTLGGVGRNCDLFDQLSRWAYQAIRDFWQPGGEDAWRTVVRHAATKLNVFDEPLGVNEVAGIARSVAKWTWRHTTPDGFRKIQAIRGKKGGVASGKVRLAASEDKRASARLMAAQGCSSRQIAAELHVNQSTVVRWVAK